MRANPTAYFHTTGTERILADLSARGPRPDISESDRSFIASQRHHAKGLRAQSALAKEAGDKHLAMVFESSALNCERTAIIAETEPDEVARLNGMLDAAERGLALFAAYRDESLCPCCGSALADVDEDDTDDGDEDSMVVRGLRCDECHGWDETERVKARDIAADERDERAIESARAARAGGGA